MIRKHNNYFFQLTVMHNFNTICVLWTVYLLVVQVLAVSHIEWGGGSWAIPGSH